jgi:hypothetical protein
MGRRFAAVLGVRRSARDRGGKTALGGGGTPAQLPPLPASAIAAWHSEITCTPTAWVDYLSTRSLAGVGTPTVAIDPGFFSGRVVAKATSSPLNFWRAPSVAPLAAIGDRPWFYMVARLRDTTIASGTEILGGMGVDAFDDDARLMALAAGGNYVAYSRSGQTVGPAVDTLIHKFSAWKDGVNRNFKVDGTLFTVADTTSLVVAPSAVGIGGPSNTNLLSSDASIAYMLICATKPTAPEEAAIDAWALAYWGV